MLIIKVGAEMDLSILEEEFFFHNGVCEKQTNVQDNSCSYINSCINTQFLPAKTGAKFI